MIANIHPNDVLEELKQVAEVLGVPVEKCATEAIATLASAGCGRLRSGAG